MTDSPEPDDESPALGLDLPEVAAPGAASPYRVLARKYRPQTFHELIGQDAIVKTLANAIERGRIAHAFLLTGVRGVGKTSTARLVAKALNCVGPDGQGGPTIEPCGVCEPCQAIAEGRFIDVLEMDAASNTKVEQMRELLDGVVYATSGGRYRIYIIDEVHMLSTSSFNALLKTLEEPPEHVKFIFATTEVHKVPLTVLSRCQRFDLRRISSANLAGHFAEISKAEGVEVDPDALGMIAKSSEGSVRDGLSILDQAIAHGDGAVSAEQVRDMLGLADRGRIRRMLQTILSGDATQALADLDEAHSLGIDPSALLRGLMEELHVATRVKAGAGPDATDSAEQRQAAETLAGQLSWALIHRLWQMLLKALTDVTVAPDPQEAAAMGLLRLIHAADLPDPAALLTRLSRDGTAPVRTPGSPAASAPSGPAAQLPGDFRALLALLEREGKHQLAVQLHDQVGLVRYAPPELSLKPLRPLGSDWSRDLAATLKSVTGTSWQIALSDGPGEPSLLEQDKIAEEQVRSEVLSDPGVQAVMDAFPDAQLESFSTTKGA